MQKELAELLHRLRTEKKMSRFDLAEACDISEVMVWCLENNKRKFTLEAIIKTFGALDVPIHIVFLFLEDSKTAISMFKEYRKKKSS